MGGIAAIRCARNIRSWLNKKYAGQTDLSPQVRRLLFFCRRAAARTSACSVSEHIHATHPPTAFATQEIDPVPL